MTYFYSTLHVDSSNHKLFLLTLWLCFAFVSQKRCAVLTFLCKCMFVSSKKIENFNLMFIFIKMAVEWVIEQGDYVVNDKIAKR